MSKKNHQKRLSEKTEEKLFRLVMNRAAEKEGKSFLKEQERLKSDPKNRPPPEEIQRFSRRIDTLIGKDARHIRKKDEPVMDRFCCVLPGQNFGIQKAAGWLKSGEARYSRHPLVF